MPIRLEADNHDGPDIESQSVTPHHTKPLLVRILNGLRIHNIPIVNLVTISVLFFFLMKLTFRYTGLYMKSSLITIIVTNLVLYGISETLAQSILSYKPNLPLFDFRINEQPLRDNEISVNAGDIVSLQNDDGDDEYRSDEEGVNRFIDYIQEDNPPVGARPYEVPDPTTVNANILPLTYFEFGRLARFMLWGGIMGVAQCLWYKFLQIYSKEPKFIEVLRKVLTDQLCYSPVSLFCFFTYGTMVLENGTWEDAMLKLSKVYLQTLMVNYSVWFPVQFFNFLIVPRSYQVPFSSSISVLWNCYLSMKNSKS